MASTTRLLALLFCGAIVCAISACAEPQVTLCGASGVLCPKGTHCAAAQGICIPDQQTCGDSRMDMGEVCDDGNNLDGDGCSLDCRSDESCGNGKVDKPIASNAKDPKNEDCEPPSRMDVTSGFFCKATCKFAFCGNGVTDGDIDEICDDGNTVGGDGCAANCKSTEKCGNGILDQPIKDGNGLPDLDNPQNEVCDDGNTNDGDDCSGDCRSTEDCGNAKVDPGEECDDGLANNGNDKDCRADCVINRCGDGHPNLSGPIHPEACDAGRPFNDGGTNVPAPERSRLATPREAADCNIDCTIPSCGDSKVNRSFLPDGLRGEQCDNGTGVNANSADCTANCQVNVCGDDLKNTAGPLHTEGCDDGNRDDTDDCTNACIGRGCGDSIVNPANEECDLGPANAETGACRLGCLLPRCGDGQIQTGVEQCDNGAGNGTIGNNCSSTCRTRTCGNGIIDPGEQCDRGSANADNADCRSDCVINRCGDGHLKTVSTHPEACEGFAPAVPPGSINATPVETEGCNINCTIPACGDRILNRHFRPQRANGPGQSPFPEQCDDGDPRASGDGCSADCLHERCGNGIKDVNEQCDGTDGVTPPQVCSATCFIQACGNGITDPGEECDNGSSANGNDKDCRADCVINRCGDGHRKTTGTNVEECDGGPVAGTGVRTAVLTNTASCNSNCKNPSCGDSFVNPLFLVPPLGTLAEQCDPPGPGCSTVCRLQRCGNGVQDPNEQCDDGNAFNDDACTTQCTNARCGDGFPRTGVEQCDDGNSSNTDACTNACTSATCGDGFIRTGVEECDDPTHATTCAWTQNFLECTVCDPVDCQEIDGTSLFCGDGVRQPEFEECDDASVTGGPTCGTCSNDCQVFASQGATGLIFAAKAVDYKLPAAPPTDKFTLSDGFNTRTFELVVGTGSGGGIILVPIQGADSNDQVAERIEDEINGSGLTIIAQHIDGTGIVTLTNTVRSARGDATIQNNVLTTNFGTSGMSNSRGGTCPEDQACTSNFDCRSNDCVIDTGVIGECAAEPSP
jgi:cysteine-rich repeat protein